MADMNLSEKSNVSKQVEKEIQTQLLQGHSVKDIAEYNNTTYGVVYGFRRKMVRAGILKRLYSKKKSKNSPSNENTVSTVKNELKNTDSQNLQIITSKFNTTCFSTGKHIKKGDIMYYDRNNKKGYHISYLPNALEEKVVKAKTSLDNSQYDSSFTLMLNNTEVSICDAKFVRLSKGKLEVKY